MFMNTLSPGATMATTPTPQLLEAQRQEGESSSAAQVADALIMTCDALRKSNLKPPFPWKLLRLLEATEMGYHQHIVSWLPDGSGFKIHKEKEFSETILDAFFNQAKMKSFTRQLYLYGFVKVSAGPNVGAFTHPSFVRGNRESCLSIKRNQNSGDRRHTKKARRDLWAGGIEEERRASSLVALATPQELLMPSKVMSSSTGREYQFPQRHAPGITSQLDLTTPPLLEVLRNEQRPQNRRNLLDNITKEQLGPSSREEYMSSRTTISSGSSSGLQEHQQVVGEQKGENRREQGRRQCELLLQEALLVAPGLPTKRPIASKVTSMEQDSRPGDNGDWLSIVEDTLFSIQEDDDCAKNSLLDFDHILTPRPIEDIMSPRLSKTLSP